MKEDCRMTRYPKFVDTLAYANLKKGQIPFYIMDQWIEGETPLHYHDFAEFSFVYGGAGQETINGYSYPLQSGTVRFLLPQQIHSVTGSVDNPLRLYCCMFDFNVLFDSHADSEICNILLRTGESLPYYSQLHGQAFREMKDLCESMLEEHRSGNFGRNAAIRAKLSEALVMFLRSFHPSVLSQATTDQKPSSHLDWEIIRFVNANFFRRIHQKSLSQRFGVSPSYISRMFRKYLGRSFLDHLHMLRIQRATSLLHTTNMSILEIAEDSGFVSFRSFSRIFKDATGMTPSEYRQMSHANPSERACAE